MWTRLKMKWVRWDEHSRASLLEAERIFVVFAGVSANEWLLEAALVIYSTMLRLSSSTSQSNLDGALTLSKHSIKRSCCWVPWADHSSSVPYIQETGSDSPGSIPLQPVWTESLPCIDAFCTVWISLTHVTVAVRRACLSILRKIMGSMWFQWKWVGGGG